MAKVGRLSVVVTAGTSGLTRGLRASETAIDRFVGRAGKASSVIGGQMRNGLNATIPAIAKLSAGATAAATAIGYLTMKSIDAVGDANDFAKSVGVSYTELRKLQKAAGLSGVDLATMNVALMKMSDVLGGAFGGNKAAIESFTNIGVSVESLRRLRPEQQFLAIGDAINRIKDPSEKIAAARDIFGRSGGALVSFFMNAEGDMENAGKALDSFGISLSQLDVEKIDAAGDAMGEFKFITEGVGNQLAKNFAPLITDVSERLLGMIDEAGGVGSAMDRAFGAGVEYTGDLLDAAESLNIGWLKFKRTVTGVGVILADVSKIVTKPAEKFSDWMNGDETEKRLQSISPDKRAEYNRLLAESGGYQSENLDMSGGLRAENADIQRQIKEAEDSRTKRGSLGDRFKAWEKSAQAKGNMNAAAALADASVTRLEAEEAITEEAEKQTKEKKEQLRLETGGQGKFALMAFNGVGSVAKPEAKKAEKEKGAVAAALAETGGPVAMAASSEQEVAPMAARSVPRAAQAAPVAAAVAAPGFGTKEYWDAQLFGGGESGEPKWKSKQLAEDRPRGYESKRPVPEMLAREAGYSSKIPQGEPAYKAKMGDSMQAAVSGGMPAGVTPPTDMTKTNQLLESINNALKAGAVGRLA